MDFLSEVPDLVTFNWIKWIDLVLLMQVVCVADHRGNNPNITGVQQRGPTASVQRVSSAVERVVLVHIQLHRHRADKHQDSGTFRLKETSHYLLLDEHWVIKVVVSIKKKKRSFLFFSYTLHLLWCGDFECRTFICKGLFLQINEKK